MPKEFARTERVAGSIRRELSRLIHEDLNDPRVNGVTITDVRVSRDLGHARVWFSVLDPEAGTDAASEALRGAAGYLRRQLGRELRMRAIPELNFEADESIALGARLIDKIEDAVRHDESSHRDSPDDSDNDE